MKVRKITKRGKEVWQAQWFEARKQHRRVFGTNAGAAAFASNHARESSGLGESWASVPGRDRSEMMAAMDRARLGEYSLLGACEFFERNRSRAEVCALPDLGRSRAIRGR